MAYYTIKKNKVFAKPGGDVYEDQAEGLTAFKRGEAIQVEWQDIIIYSQEDIDYCYWHHVKGRYNEKMLDEEYSVLRRKNEINEIIPMPEFIDDLRFALETACFKKGEMDFFFPADEYAAYKFKKGQNTTPNYPRRAKLHFRGVRQLTRKELAKFAKIAYMSEDELTDAAAYIDTAKNSKKYRIRFIWGFEHTDIRSA
jgi:hypothetical protein